MIDLNTLQREVYRNKVNKGWNVIDVPLEIARTHGELSELFDAYMKKSDTVCEELADVAIYLLGLAEILGISLEEQLLRKVAINARREYTDIDGVNVRMNDGV